MKAIRSPGRTGADRMSARRARDQIRSTATDCAGRQRSLAAPAGGRVRSTATGCAGRQRSLAAPAGDQIRSTATDCASRQRSLAAPAGDQIRSTATDCASRQRSPEGRRARDRATTTKQERHRITGAAPLPRFPVLGRSDRISTRLPYPPARGECMISGRATPIRRTNFQAAFAECSGITDQAPTQEP